MTGVIFDVKRYAVHDGPGIRTTVFLKGCPLRCWWCHNPESLKKSVQSITRTVKLDGKTFDVKEQIGREILVEELMTEVLKDSMFYEESGGGVTFSGGEPFMQPDFLAAATKACHDQGLHVAVDTSGVVAHEHLVKVIDNVDLFLYDIKHLNDEKHRNYTGVSNKQVLDNLAFILENGKRVIIRYPVIPGLNDESSQLKALEMLLEVYRGRLNELHLLPYHNIARGKYERLDLPFQMDDTSSLSKADLEPLKERFIKSGVKVKIGG